MSPKETNISENDTQILNVTKRTVWNLIKRGRFLRYVRTPSIELQKS